MKRRKQQAGRYAFYNDVTEPMLVTTTPIPLYLLPHQSGLQRFWRGLLRGIAAIIQKIQQLLALAYAITLLLLFGRLLLTFSHFSVDGLAPWVYRLSDPLVQPFQAATFLVNFGTYTVDTGILAALGVYTVGMLLARKFLHLITPRVA